MNKIEFIQRVVSINPNTRFLYYFNGYPSKTWYKYEEIINKYPNLFKINQQMLRTGIITETFEELRLDIDTKENGSKSLDASIVTAEKIATILDNHKIKYSMYYSGGSGIHFHLLYNSKPFKKFENQKKVRELICEYLGFVNDIDKQLLSNNQAMTCESYSKRNSKDNSLKIYIGEGGRKSIKEYIEENKFKTIINENFFNEINDFDENIVKYVEKEYKASTLYKPCKIEGKSEHFISADTYNTSQIKREGFIMPSSKVIIQHLITFSKIYNEKGNNSTNNFYTVVCTYLFSSTLSYEKSLQYFNMLFDVFKCPNNLTCSREQKLKSIIENYGKGKTKVFINNPYFTKQDFYTDYYSMFPKKEVQL